MMHMEEITFKSIVEYVLDGVASHGDKAPQPITRYRGSSTGGDTNWKIF